MTIGEASAKYDIPCPTLRFYEKEGLIKSHRKKSGIRDYTEEDCRQIEFVTCMRHAGLSIEALKEYLSLFAKGDKTIPLRIELLNKQKEELLEKKQAIEASLARLEYKISHYQEILLMEKGKETK
ncbi:MAG: MerR family transcriptional regulator [Bacilli bacterium]|jgi:DNA-binding transcriptional MerR regulator|nr:MerR family transcriptional regulator [Bacilli bacterium]